MKPFTVYDPVTGEIAYSGTAAEEQPVPDGLAIIYAASLPGQRVNVDDPDPKNHFVEDAPALKDRSGPAVVSDPPPARPSPWVGREEFSALLERVDALEKATKSG